MIKKLSFLLVLIFHVSCSHLKKIEGVKENKKVFNVVWNRALDPEYDTGNLPIGLSGPFIFDNMLFIGDLTGKMSAHQIENGRMSWSVHEKDEIGCIAGIYKDHVIYGSYNGRVFSRHYQTGALKYSVDLGSPVESMPVIYKDRLFYHIRNHQIFALDAITGKVLWSYRRSVPFTTTLQRVSDVLPIDNKLIVGFADGDLVALNIDDGNLLWEKKLGTGTKFIDVDATPLFYKGRIYAGSVAGPLSVIHPETGVIERTIDVTISRSPVLIDDEMFVGTMSGDIVVLDEVGSILRRKQVGTLGKSEGISSIVSWKGQVVVTTLGGKVYFINKKSLDILEVYDLGSRFSSVLGVAQTNGKYLAIYSSRNRLYVFK